MAEQLSADAEILAELDLRYSVAEYCFSKKCTKPKVNGRGYINIVKGASPAY